MSNLYKDLHVYKIKTKSNVIIAILTLSTIMGLLTLTVGSTKADYGITLYLEPSGDVTGITDAENIQNALDEASTAGPEQHEQ